jgi:hypothetical protein
MRSLLICMLLAACGPSRVGPPVESRSLGPLPNEDEAALAAAIEKKRAGDPIGAWALVERIPPSSPARFDPRYTEVMAAYSDARTQQIGVEIAGPKGGGPSETAPATAATGAPLTGKTIDRFINDHRASLRHDCYGDHATPVSFQLRVLIDPNGRVTDASLKDVHGDTSVARCVRDRAMTWVFPRSSEGAEHPTKFYFGR